MISLASGCDPSNVCGDPIKACRVQCKGDESNGICVSDKTCTGGHWYCECTKCQPDMRGADFSVQDLTSHD